MSEKEIIAKAQKLGIDINMNKEHSAMQNIAESLGMDPNNYNPNDIVNRLNEIDREENKPQNNSDYYDNPSNYNNHNHFGQREYNEAKKDGVYDKDYYKNKDEELKEKVEKAKSDVNNKTKEEVDLDENSNAKWKEGETPSHRTWENGKETTNGAPTKNVNKTRTEQLKDKANLLKAQNDRFQNKINGAKAKAYNMLHPGEALKDRAKSAVKNTAKNVGNTIKTGAKKAAGKGIKAIGALIKKNPYVLLIIAGIILLVIVLALILSSGVVNDDPILSYCDTIDENNFSIKSTPFGEGEFVNRVVNYYESLKESVENIEDDSESPDENEENNNNEEQRIQNLKKFYEENPCYDSFTNPEILKTIYSISLDNELSPEFALVHAIVNYCLPNSNDNVYNNFWKLDCGTYYCIFGSLDDSVEYLADLLYKYDYLEDFLSENYVGEDLTNNVEFYVNIRDSIFYGGNYTFDCDADYSYTGTGAYPDKGTIFRQGDPLWASIHLGHSAATMGRQGCAVTSIANGISKYAPYLNVDYFDAGVFINALNKGGCFTETGNIYWGCNAITGIAPTVHFVTSISGIGGNSNMTKINYLNQYNPNEYFLIIGYRNSYTNGHYVLFNGLIDENTYNSIDPSSLSGGIVNHNISEFNQIVVYKYN